MLRGAVRRWIAPLFQKRYEFITTEENPTVVYTAMQPMVNASMRPTKYGFMPAQHQGDLITAQTILRGVQPVFAAEVARANDQKVRIS